MTRGVADAIFCIAYNARVLGGTVIRYGSYYNTCWASHTATVKHWEKTFVTIEGSTEGTSELNNNGLLGNVFWTVFGY